MPGSDLPTFGDVERAARRLGARVHRTPVFSSATLSRAAGAPVFLKAELFQRTGSFKPRGVFTRLDALSPEERARGVISISAGNHAQALAYACGREGLDCLVVMWQGASPLKAEAARGYGATVDTAAAGPPEAFERLEELRATSGRVLVHPFDDPLVIAGQGTVGLEICEDLPDVEVVVVPVGGGGLVSGVATAVKTAAAHDVRIVAVEPAGSAALGAALEAGRPVRPERSPTIADGLDAPFLGDTCFEICRELVDESVTVSEAELGEGLRFLYSRAKLAAEPAGAAGVAALLARKIDVENAAAVAIVVSGGNVDPEKVSAILKEHPATRPQNGVTT